MSKVRTKSYLSHEQITAAANTYGIPVAAVYAVKQVEAPKGAFDDDDFPVTLFEGHKFHAFTGGRFDAKYPSISYPVWDRSKYKMGDAEKARLALAISLDRDAALQSASWGMFQIMGFNWKECGCNSVQEFVNRQCDSEAAQLDLFCKYLVSRKLIQFLVNEKWTDFASRYNGPGYAENNYHSKLADAYRSYKGMV